MDTDQFFSLQRVREKGLRPSLNRMHHGDVRAFKFMQMQMQA
jgi:hypothetical protein